MASEFLVDLIDHKRRVASYMQIIANELFQRAAVHDNSKFSPEEYEAYDAAFPNFKKYAFGTDEMKAVYESIKPALEHHFRENRHHPEHFTNGVNDMTLIDVLEMVCDWLAASHRSNTGIDKGLKINKARYGISDQLFAIIDHTVEDLGSKDR
jgi:hypothetical protein